MTKNVWSLMSMHDKKKKNYFFVTVPVCKCLCRELISPEGGVFPALKNTA